MFVKLNSCYFNGMTCGMYRLLYIWITVALLHDLVHSMYFTFDTFTKHASSGVSHCCWNTKVAWLVKVIPEDEWARYGPDGRSKNPWRAMPTVSTNVPPPLPLTIFVIFSKKHHDHNFSKIFVCRNVFLPKKVRFFIFDRLWRQKIFPHKIALFVWKIALLAACVGQWGDSTT